MAKKFNKNYISDAGTCQRTTVSVFITLFLVCNVSARGEKPLLVINERNITKNEFLHYYEKNNLKNKSLKPGKYLQLFTDYLRKAEQAKDEGLQNRIEFIQDMAKYRNSLVRPYLTDSAKEEEYALEAYRRTLVDLNVSHIFFKSDHSTEHDDSMLTLAKALEVKDRILNGKNFNELARKFSDDPVSAKKGGNLGFITAFMTVYPFETAAYRLKKGEISLPVWTGSGYHLIKVDSIRKSQGEVKIAHIIIDPRKTGESLARNKILAISDSLKSGISFELLARNNSSDKTTADMGGELPWFKNVTINPEIQHQVSTLKNPGDISEPFLTELGWHILKLIEYRNIRPYNEIRQELKDNIIRLNDERKATIHAAFIKRMKKDWKFTEFQGAFPDFLSRIDSFPINGKLQLPDSLVPDLTLFTIDGRPVTQNLFLDFVKDQDVPSGSVTGPEYIKGLYDKFMEYRLTNYENYRLTDKYPFLKFQLEEYRDGALLQAITEQKIWSGMTSDNEGWMLYVNKRRPASNKETETQETAVMKAYQEKLEKDWIKELHKTYKVKIDRKEWTAVKKQINTHKK